MIEVFNFLSYIFAVVFGAIAAYTDYNEGKIYDGTTLIMILAGLFLSAILLHQEFWLLVLLWITTGIILVGGIYLNRRGSIGGGDVKLLMGYNLLIPFSAFVIFPISMLLGLILHFRNLDKYIKLGPLAFASLAILIIASLLFGIFTN